MKGDGSCLTGDSIRDLVRERGIDLIAEVVSLASSGMAVALSTHPGLDDVDSSVAEPGLMLYTIAVESEGLISEDQSAAMMRAESGGLGHFPIQSVLAWPGSPAFDLMYLVIPITPISFWRQLNKPPKGPGHGSTGGNRSQQSGPSHSRQR